MRFLLPLVTLILLASLALAGAPSCGIPVQRGNGYRASYHNTAHHDYHEEDVRVVKLIFASANFDVFDYHVRDLFLFTGPPAQIPPGATLGINGGGKEIIAPAGTGIGGAGVGLGASGIGAAGVVPGIGTAAGTPIPANVTTVSQSSLATIVAEDHASDEGLSVLGYEEGVKPNPTVKPGTESALATSPRARLRAQVLVSFTSGQCAKCHTLGDRPKGGVVLYQPGGRELVKEIDWKVVLAYVSAPDGQRCPPAPRPALSEEQKRPIRELAGQ